MTRLGNAFVVGETIFDIVRRDGDEVEYLGGSPANVALGLARLGHEVELLTNLGHDARGRDAHARLASEGVSLHAASMTERATPTALATIGSDGAATYEFDIAWSIPHDATIPQTSLVHVGSIGLFMPPGNVTAQQLVANASDDVLVTVDPNIRPALMPAREQVRREFESVCARANLVKLSDEDATWLYPEFSPQDACRYLADLLRQGHAADHAMVVLTLGAEGLFSVIGSAATRDSSEVRVDPVRVTVADTISAGDTVMASLCSSLLVGGVQGFLADPHAALTQAAHAAALAVSVPGPNPPTRDDLEQALREA